ncbi:MAG: ATP-dependent DNA helicase, partial [Gammaproteobacteria bacterium]|nr:ATP-dependent DNA helicase [Gammaproteobacteria bacterium]
VPESSPFWSQVTSTSDNCLGQACPLYDKCFVVKARRAAITADIVVVNHHLLLADTRLKEDGFGELLPDADVVIVDEAHQIADLATSVFGTQWSLRRLQRWLKDAQLTALQTQQHKLSDDFDALLKLSRDSRLALQGLQGSVQWRDVPPGFVAYLRELQESMAGLTETIKALSDDVEWESLWKRMGMMLAGLQLFVQPMENGNDAHIRWMDVNNYGYTLHDTPIEIAAEFKALMKSYASSWIFTSATLAVGESFKGFSEPLGIEEAEFSLLDSSFNFRSQSMLLLPKGLPEPNDRNFAAAFTDLAEDLIEASGGGAFLLFTSYRMLNLVADRLRDRVDKDLLIQGQMPRATLLDKFRQDGDAILLGTSTFWEGVDVQGQALRLVMIDKLPFASPGDPVLSARINAMRKRGDNPFKQLQLPQAVIALKQGVGRLIRDEEDYGVMVLCDPRIKTKSYGKTFLQSLPDMPVTDSFEKVKSFFKFYDHA